MSRNYELWQRASGPVPEPVTVPATVVPSDLGWPTRPIQTIQTESEETQPEASEWLHPLAVLRKHWRWSVLFAIAIAASVAVFTILMSPVYEPEARLEVDAPGSEVVALEGRNEGGAADYVETQAQNLQSDGLALEVIRALHLDQNPDFQNPDLKDRDLDVTGKPTGAAAPM